MIADTPPGAASRGGRNPALWLVVGLPLLAVAASLISVLLAVRGGDPPLPERYHWEGAQLDADQTRLDTASQRGISANFNIDQAAGQCRVVLQGAAPSSLQLNLAHATLARLDRHVLLQREGAVYVGRCTPLAPGHWWLEIADTDASWLIRQRIGH